MQINHDIDISTLPLVAFYKGAVEQDKRAQGFSKGLLLKTLQLQVCRGTSAQATRAYMHA